MRITIRLDDQLLKFAKRLAHDTGTSLTAIIEDALRQILSRRVAMRPRNPAKLTTVSGRGVHPGVDLDDSSALLDFMEQSQGSSF